MQRPCLLVLFLCAACRVPGTGAPTAQPREGRHPSLTRQAGAEPRLAHDVYFALNDSSPAAVDDFVRACHERLAHLPGVVVLDAGPREVSFDRPVNDLDFDVALHVVFASRAAYETYLVAPDHVAFVDEYLPRVESLRVFDWSP